MSTFLYTFYCKKIGRINISKYVIYVETFLSFLLRLTLPGKTKTFFVIVFSLLIITSAASGPVVEWRMGTWREPILADFYSAAIKVEEHLDAQASNLHLIYVILLVS